jgi:cyclophilin family peptidyl-prolyl cis-trans isomerase
MNTIRHWILLLLTVMFLSCSSHDVNDNAVVLINTSAGDFKVELYNETPLHRDNFLKLVNSGLYEGVSFHRVINGFMVQTGDVMTKPGNILTEKDSVNTYTIPSEFNRKYYHKKGALAAARMGGEVNPYMRSSGTQFYVVQGKKLTDEEIPVAEQEVNNRIKQAFFLRFITEIADSLSKSGTTLPPAAIQEQASLRLFDWLDRSGEYKMTDEMKNAYKTIGGTPRLDGTYTVFGEVIEGVETIDRIAEVRTDASDRPLDDIRIIKMKIVKQRKK